MAQSTLPAPKGISRYQRCLRKQDFYKVTNIVSYSSLMVACISVESVVIFLFSLLNLLHIFLGSARCSSILKNLVLIF